MENNYALYIFPKAAQDMENIFDYISSDLCNPSAASKLIGDFEDAFQTVCAMPFSGSRVNNEYVSDNTLRKLIVHNYIAFYRVNEDEKRLEIVRVLYGMMNFAEIL